MPPDQEPKPITIDAEGLAALLAQMTIEIVRTLYPIGTGPEELLTEIANNLFTAAEKAPRPVDRALIEALAKALVRTEDSGLVRREKDGV